MLRAEVGRSTRGERMFSGLLPEANPVRSAGPVRAKNGSDRYPFIGDGRLNASAFSPISIRQRTASRRDRPPRAVAHISTSATVPGASLTAMASLYFVPGGCPEVFYDPVLKVSTRTRNALFPNAQPGFLSTAVGTQIYSYAARTELRNLPTSSLSRLLSRDSDCAAERTCEEAEPVSLAPRCTSVMLAETC